MYPYHPILNLRQNGEKLRDAALTGRPVVVVQYPTSNHDIKDMAPDDNRVVEGSASSIIAVSYEARPFGVRGLHAYLCSDTPKS